jgi:predicted aminopeptidase
MKQTILSGGVAALVLALTGCQTISYYGQAIHGQCQILNRQRPIQALLQDPTTPEPLKARLRLVLEIRQFAEKELKLPANGHYLNYADLKRRFVVWNVYATPEFSLTAKSWWYPMVGRLEYRGYFSEERARRYAGKLAAQGFDVHVGGVAAYSTLGWFRDPLLNTFIDDAEGDLAELLFHELAHQKVFVAGDTDFNEAFATAVAEEGLRRWTESRNDPAATANYEAEARRMEQFVGLIAAARARLEALYDPPAGDARAAPAPGPERPSFLRREKQRIIDKLRRDYQRLRAEWGGRDDYDRWFSESLNNAQLNTVDTYYHLVPGFRKLLQKHGDRLDDFYKEVRAISALKEEQRHRELDDHESTPPAQPSAARPTITAQDAPARRESRP